MRSAYLFPCTTCVSPGTTVTNDWNNDWAFLSRGTLWSGQQIHLNMLVVVGGGVDDKAEKRQENTPTKKNEEKTCLRRDLN